MSEEKKKHNAAALPGQVVHAKGKTNAALGKAAVALIEAGSKVPDVEKIETNKALSAIAKDTDAKLTADIKSVLVDETKKHLKAATLGTGLKPTAPVTKEEKVKLSKSVTSTLKKVDKDIKKDKAPVKSKPVAKPKAEKAEKPKAAKKAPAAPKARVPRSDDSKLSPEAKKELAALLKEREEIREKHGATSREYNAIQSRIRYVRNPDKLKAIAAKYRPAANEKAKARYDEDPAFRKERIKAARAWRKEHPEGVIAYQKRRAKDPHYKGTVIVRNLINSGLRPNGGVRGPKSSVKFSAFVGCAREKFREHIESQFKKGMNWENRGDKWTVGFEKGLSEFDCSTDEGKRKAGHYKNVIVLELTDAPAV